MIIFEPFWKAIKESFRYRFIGEDGYDTFFLWQGYIGVIILTILKIKNIIR